MVEDPHDDPWAAARAAQRDDVRTALAPRERRCPACGAPQRRGGRVCDECGQDLTARYRRGESRRKQIFAAIAALVVIAAATPFVLSWREDAAREQERAERRQAALEAAEVERLTRDAQPVRAEGRPAADGAGPLEHRAALVAQAERLITDDAHRRAAAGRLDGDVEGTECHPFPDTETRRTAEEDPALARGRYDCVAYTSKFEAPELDGQKRTGLFGFPYWLVVDYADAQLVWCKVTPRAGEGGRSLAAVPVPVPCRDPTGPG
jgi:predicted nucleic acid-binding Zn ribbon protein